MGSSSLRRSGVGNDATLLGVLAELPGAALRAVVARMPVRLWRFLVGFCTIVLLLAPLLLWVSWTRSGFIAVFVSAAVALVIAYLLVRHAPEHRKL
jgi:hypothetical protein